MTVATNDIEMNVCVCSNKALFTQTGSRPDLAPSLQLASSCRGVSPVLKTVPEAPATGVEPQEPPQLTSRASMHDERPILQSRAVWCLTPDAGCNELGPSAHSMKNMSTAQRSQRTVLATDNTNASLQSLYVWFTDCGANEARKA